MGVLWGGGYESLRVIILRVGVVRSLRVFVFEGEKVCGGGRMGECGC
jgi:hypothetical protein